MTNPWGWPPVLPQPAFPGWIDTQLYNTVLGALNAGGSFDLPGPAAGFTHRIYDHLNIVANTVAPLTAIGANYQPTGMLALSGATGAGGANIQPQPPIVAAGETYRITNGGATSGRVFATYFDVAKPNWTAIRVQLVAAPASAVIIPAPAAGQVRRFVFPALTTTARNLNPRANQYNADAVAHQIEMLLGADLVSRTAAIAAGATNVAVPIGANVTLATGDLSARTVGAIVTPPNVFGFYETV